MRRLVVPQLSGRCQNNELHFALIICRSVRTSIERGERDACTKITVSDVLFMKWHFLIEKNRMTLHIEMCQESVRSQRVSS